MIESVHLKNFQAHADRTLEFTPGVNIIRGSSDAGKSAIIRAMLACITGKDFNAGYQTWNTKGSMEVTINIDGHTVVRGRDAKTNYYLVDGKRFAALRGECPSEVSSIFNMGADQLGNQYSPFYLISDSAGEVARKIQSICDLDSITKITKAATKQVSNSSSSVKSCESQVDRLESDLKKYDDVETFRKKFTRLKARCEYHEEQQEKLAKYKELRNGFDKLKACQNSAQIASLRPELDECKQRASLIKTKGLELKSLQKLQRTVMRLEQHISPLESTKNALVECKKILKDVQQMQQAFDKSQVRLKKLQNWKSDYADVVNKIEAATALLIDQRSSVEEFKDELGVCPLCGSPYHG